MAEIPWKKHSHSTEVSSYLSTYAGKIGRVRVFKHVEVGRSPITEMPTDREKTFYSVGINGKAIKTVHQLRKAAQP